MCKLFRAACGGKMIVSVAVALAGAPASATATLTNNIWRVCLMATHEVGTQDETKRECFLCTLDPKHTCKETQLEGRIVAVQERLSDGARTPVVILDTGAS